MKQVAPFLKLDADPYPVIVGGRIKYVVDAYTTANTYPYGQTADTSQLEPGAELRDGDVNYVRNSVKAVVDAYDGTVDLYMTDNLYGKKDPIIRAYAAAFPKLFKSFDQMPKELRSHLRYPEDMFRMQTTMWGHYHITRPENFYDASDQWDVAQDPGHRRRRAHGERRRVGGAYRSVLPADEAARFEVGRLPAVPAVRAALGHRVQEAAGVVHGGDERRR